MMVDFTLANLVLDGDDFLGDSAELILRKVAGTAQHDGTALVVDGDIDFTTYLNALSIGKWGQYADIGGAALELTFQGAGFSVYPTWLTPESDAPSRDATPMAVFDESDEWVTKAFAMPVPRAAHIISFAIVSDGPLHVKAGRWRTVVNESRIRDIRLAIATTTFKKEPYIERNIALVRKEIFDGDDAEVASRIRMFVVDNGRTLDAEGLSDDNVTVIPNPNVGGSGGFARGMMAAMDDGATHVLLMDDDVRVLPESFKRTLRLLTIVNDDYADAFVEGGMLNMEEPTLLFEDVAAVKRDGMYGRIKGDCHVDRISDFVRSEATDVEVDRAYGAWWYCCIPVSAIQSHGLPLPLFVRCDDVEYGLRCRPRIMTMAGICVWHEKFEGRFRASVDSYQLTRNFLVMAACDSLDPSITRAFMMRFSRTFHIYLRAMSYGTCELMLDGLSDYLEGPDFLAQVDGSELMMRNAALNESLVDVSELDEKVVTAAQPDPAYLGQGANRGPFLKVLEMVPHDRHVLPDFMLSDRPAAVYYSRGAYPARKTIARRRLVAYDQSGTKAHVREMNRDRWKSLVRRYHSLMGEYLRRKDSVAKAYRDAMPELTSRTFWERYLSKMGE